MKKGVFQKLFIEHIRLIIIGLSIIGLAALLLYQLVLVKPEYITVRIKGSPGNWWWVTPRPPDWLAFSVKKGDKEYNSANHPIAEVLGVDVYDAGGSTRDAYLTIRIEVRHNKQTNQYRYKGEPVEVGGPISLSLNNSFFPGMVIAIYKNGEEKQTYVEKTVRIRHKDRWPYEYDSVVVGDAIKDGDGNVISEILSKERVPAIRENANLSGQLVQTQSPILEDFYVTVKLKMIQHEGEYIYREEQYIKVGSKIWLLFPRYNMSAAEILSIE